MSEAPPLDVLWPRDRAGEVVPPDDTEPVLAGLYAYPDGDRTFVRANMVTTVDGAAYGADRRTGSINTAADFRVFVLLRALSDVVLAGAGTVRAERYDLPRVRRALAGARSAAGAQGGAPGLALVTRRCHLPRDQGLFDGERGPLVVTCEAAGRDALARARSLAGSDAVLVAGETEVDLSAALDWLRSLGLTRVLCEGGPQLLTALMAAALVDELCLTWSPMLVGGDAARMVGGVTLDVPLRLEHLLQGDGSLLGRWSVVSERAELP